MIRAYLLGLREGFAQPWDLSIGMTYDGDPSSLRSRAYDRGATFGQALGRCIK
jgi:hypothetical protein